MPDGAAEYITNRIMRGRRAAAVGIRGAEAREVMALGNSGVALGPERPS